MSELETEAKSTPEAVSSVTPLPARAQAWLESLRPAAERLAQAARDAHAAVEKRLGFCPGKVMLSAVGRLAEKTGDGLDGLADRLRRAGGRLQAIGGAAPAPDAEAPALTTAQEPPRATA